MKKFIVTFLFIFAPAIIAELVLRNDIFYAKMLLNNQHLQIWNSYQKKGIWPNTIIMGSSFAQTAIDPLVINNVFEKNNLNYRSQSIAISADETVIDYMNLMRILATCSHCPKNIIYAVNDVEVKKSMVTQWRDVTSQRIRDLYFINNNMDSALNEASVIDENYRYINRDLNQKFFFRIPFIGSRLVSLSEQVFSSFFDTFNKFIVQKNFLRQDEESGFASPIQSLTDESKRFSLTIYSGHLQNYSVGGGNVFFMEKFLKLAERKNIHVYIVMTPLSFVYLQTFNKQLSLYRQLIQEESRAYKIPYFDDTTFNSNDPTMFNDVNHMDIKGSRAYSSHLAIEITKYIKFPSNKN